MEDTERPAKLRKLSHDGADKDHVLSDTVNEQVKNKDAFAQLDKPAGDQDTTTSSPTKTANGSQAENAQPLSKNQLKKLRKKEEWEAGREWRKARRKEKVTERKARKREAREHNAEESNKQAIGTPVTEQKPRWQKPVKLPVTFIIDCGFDDKMVEKERISLGSQITRSYSDNSRAPFQAHLVVSSWGGLLRERFDTVLDKSYQRWKSMHFVEQDFVAAAEQARRYMNSKNGGQLRGVFEQYAPKEQQSLDVETEQVVSEAENGSTQPPAPATDRNTSPLSETTTDKETTSITTTTTTTTTNPPTKIEPPHISHLKSQSEIIYLTSDSPHTLTTLKPYSTYIIGGLVDKNRHKGICYRTACERGIKTAKLPIGEYMEMQSRFVLATNHVVEIMVRWLECGDWGEAFMSVIPKRKGGKLKGGRNRNEGGSGRGDEDRDDDGDGNEVDDGEDEVDGEDGDVQIDTDDVGVQNDLSAGGET